MRDTNAAPGHGWSSILRIRLFVLSLMLCKISIAQIIIAPDSQVVEPFKNNPVWEDFKTAQYDRIQVLQTLITNVWDFVDSTQDVEPETATRDFIRHIVPAFPSFFKESEYRLTEGNPYAILDPAVGIHTVETLLQIANYGSNKLLNKLKVKWMEVDALALRIHNVYNTTLETLIKGPHSVNELLELKTTKYAVWISPVSGGGSNGTIKNWSLDKISKQIDHMISELGTDNHLIRGLVKLLSSMTQLNVDYSMTLNHYCYGNNEFGVFQDIYNVVTDAALYLCLADMKKLVLDVLMLAFSKLYRNEEATTETPASVFETMQQRIESKIGFEYLDGSDYSELPHPPIFKCDKPPLERGKISQWGKNRITGLSPKAGATNPFDPQAGPEKEDGDTGYFDDRQGQYEYVSFSKAYFGYVESELVLNPVGMCKGTCKDYKHPTPTCPGKNCDFLRASHCNASDPGCMGMSKCPLYAQNCERTSSSVQTCLSENPSRYFSHIVLDHSRTFGSEDGHCATGMLTARERWEMEFGVLLTAPQYCELCMCTCLTSQDSSERHYVSLEPVEVDVGHVVTAVKFYQEDNILYLMVEQGKPIRGGEIDMSSLSWKQIQPANKESGKSTVHLGPGGFTRLHFDIVVGEPNEIVTGVRFDVKDEAISLAAQTAVIVNPAQKSADVSLESDRRWVAASEKNVIRKGLVFHRPDVPTKQKGPSMPDVVYDSYVEFTVTDYELDAGQSTIPYFDTQPVHHYETRRWLQGLGLMHKGKHGFGGFISPIVIPSKWRRSHVS